MIQVQYMKPFYTKINGKSLRLVFAYQYFSIVKDNELYQFVPVEGKEMIVNLATKEIENLSEIFVFQRGNRFIRLPLYQLLLISNIHDYLSPILEKASKNSEITNLAPEHDEKPEIHQVIRTLELQNIDRLIDEALEKKDKERFYQLVQQKEKLCNSSLS